MARDGVVTFSDSSPTGKRTKAWVTQANEFAALEPGAELALIHGDAGQLTTAVIAGDPEPYRSEDGDGVKLSIELTGEVARLEFRYPFLLQDPRSLFQTALPGS